MISSAARTRCSDVQYVEHVATWAAEHDPDLEQTCDEALAGDRAAESLVLAAVEEDRPYYSHRGDLATWVQRGMNVAWEVRCG